MKLLVLGGTRFLGRHLVDAALARGDDVTVFTRGKQPNPWGDAVTALAGNRDPAIAPGLAALESGTWDAVVDTSGYVPRVVRASAELLAARVAPLSLRVVDLGVHRREPAGTRRDRSRRSARRSGDRGDRQVLRSAQGRVRARGQRRCTARARSTCGRASSWARTIRPTASATGSRASCIRACSATARRRRSFRSRRRGRCSSSTRATSRPSCSSSSTRASKGRTTRRSPAGQWTFGALVEALVAVGGARRAAPRVDRRERRCSSTRSSRGRGCRCGFPQSFADEAGFMQIDCTKAERAGLRTRPLAQTIADTAAWLAQRDNAGAWKDVLTRRRRARDPRQDAEHDPRRSRPPTSSSPTAPRRTRGRCDPAALPRAASRWRTSATSWATTRSRWPITPPSRSFAPRSSARIPTHGIHGEEHGREDGTSPLTWVIDPIDGTKSFILGQLHWGVLIALHDGTRAGGRRRAPAVRRRDIPGRARASRRNGGEGRDAHVAHACMCEASRTRWWRPPIPRQFVTAAEKRALAAVSAERAGSCATAAIATATRNWPWDSSTSSSKTASQPYDIQALIPIVQAAGGRGHRLVGRPLRPGRPGAGVRRPGAATPICS